MGIDIRIAKEAAAGRWPNIAAQVIGISDDYLSNKHGPCPKCGGGNNQHRWRVFDDFSETGGAVCTQCGKWGDGFALAQWFLGIPLNDAIEKVCNYLGVSEPKKKRSKKQAAAPTSTRSAETEESPAKGKSFDLEFREWNDRLFSRWAATKQPITKEAVQLAGGQFAKYRGTMCIAIPVIGRDGKTPSGYALYNATGGPILHKANKDAPIEKLKVKLIGSAKESGWLGMFQPGKETIKAEGVSDMLAILSTNLDGSVVSNPFGATEDPLGKYNQWMLEQLRDEIVYTVHDQDHAGQSGATWMGDERKRPGWSTAIAIVAKESRNVSLPFDLVETHGKDSRDYLNELIASGRTLEEAGRDLLDRARSSAIVEKPDGFEIKLGSSEPTESGDEIEIDAEAEENRHHVDDPHRLASLNLKRYQEQHGRHLAHWNQTWYRYKDGVYLEIANDHLTSRISESIKREFDRVWKEEYRAYAIWRKSKDYDPEKDKGPPKVRKVKGALVADVYSATKGMCALESGQQMHDWIREKESHDGICIAADNGILNITKAISDQEYPREQVLIPKTPNWFSTSKLKFEFNENAQCPNWVRFLDDVFSGDEQSIDALQKWFGYLLTPDNSLNKIMFVIGEPRSGKGTVVQVMKELFGESNVATPKLSDLSKDFSLQPLANKTVAIIPDARLSRRADESMITETLLSISGGDPQDVSRKFKDTLSSYQMKCRFTIFSNLVPNLRDLSSAFITRCIFLHMPNSYLGREDFTLIDKLKAELPGILNWAIVGRHLLNQSKRIVQPAKGTNFVDELKSLTSPILSFIESQCEFGNIEYEIDTKDFFGTWESWCKENDVEHAGTVQNFCRKVKAVKPSVDTRDYRIGATRGRKMIGIRLKDDLF